MIRNRAGASALATLTAVLAPTLAGAQADPNRGTSATVDDRMWSNEMSEPTPWGEAEDFCDTLETEGFTDWRLPTLAELESLHDPSLPGGIRLPFALDDCCAWSSVDLVEIEADRKGNLPEPGSGPSNYFWGFLFDGGISYYSNRNFPDGIALCVREA